MGAGFPVRICWASSFTEFAEFPPVPLSVKPGRGGAGVNDKPPGLPKLPTSALRAFTARALNRPLVWASAGPPIMTVAGVCEAISRANRIRRSALTPVISSTLSELNSGKPLFHPSMARPA